jgi:hypothetical protein
MVFKLAQKGLTVNASVLISWWYLHLGPQVLISYVVLCKTKPHEEVVPILFSTHISAYGHGVLQVRK